MQSILIVDDMESIHEMLDAVVQPLGYNTIFAQNGEEALKIYQEQKPDLVLADIRMSPMDGLELTKELKSINSEVLVIMMSGHADVENAMVSLKLGAFDYLTKPFKVDQLIAAINRAANLEKQTLEINGETTSIALLGESRFAHELRSLVERAVRSDTPLLLQGESGTQKRLIAHAIHRAQFGESSVIPFITLDCKQSEGDEINEQLLGPLGNGGSAMEDANGGTLYVAHVDALPLESQKALGELIENEKVPTRLICSSRMDLGALVEEGHFDDSLYSRISALSGRVANLRKRSEDIPWIANSVLKSIEAESVTISDAAIDLLKDYRWPGNLTELSEVIAAASSHCSNDEITPDDLPEKIRDVTQWSSLAEIIEEITLDYKERVLRACQGDPKKAAKILGCDAKELSAK